MPRGSQENVSLARLASLDEDVRRAKIGRNARARRFAEGAASTKAPASAAYVIAQGATVPADLPNAGNLAVQANTGLNLSGFSLGFDPAGVTSGGALRIANGGTGATTAAGAVSNLGAVPTTRAINTTAPITGGGDLSADRTIAISDFVASGGSHARGAVPDPPASSGSVKYLCENATWAIPIGTFISRTIYKTATSGTHTFSNKTKTVLVRGKGPGGGGGGVAGAASNAAAAGGGGGGGEFDVLLAVSPSDTATYNVPAGGAGGTAGNNPGSAAASDTTFTYGATTYTGAKGSGGATAAAGTTAQINAGGNPGTATNGDWNSSGQPGGYGIVMSASVAKSGDGAPGWNGTGGAAGRAAANGAGSAGSGNGSGGSGARQVNNAANSAGGDGAPGIIEVWEFS